MWVTRLCTLLAYISGIYGSHLAFDADDASEDIKIVIQTIKAININPLEASVDDIKICVDANFNEETDHSREFIEALITEIQLYIQEKTLSSVGM